jgi:hypothetical protein
MTNRNHMIISPIWALASENRMDFFLFLAFQQTVFMLYVIQIHI